MRGAKPGIGSDKAALKDVAAAPVWMSADARAEWDRVMPILVERKIMTIADLAGFENYCVATGTVREMERHLQEHGHVFEAMKMDNDGNLVTTGLKRNPAVGIQADAMTRARLLAAELGLTPVSRSRPAIRDDDDDDSLVD